MGSGNYMFEVYDSVDKIIAELKEKRIPPGTFAVELMKQADSRQIIEIRELCIEAICASRIPPRIPTSQPGSLKSFIDREVDHFLHKMSDLRTILQACSDLLRPPLSLSNNNFPTMKTDKGD